MEKALIGLVASESKRHTAENIKIWTEQALKDIGLTAAQSLWHEPGQGVRLAQTLASSSQTLMKSLFRPLMFVIV